MPSYLLAAPILVLAAGALLTGVLAWVGFDPGRAVAALSAWTAAALLIGLWASTRTLQEAAVGSLGAGIDLGFRLDGATFAFGMAILLPAAILLTFQPRGAAEAAIAAVLVAAGLLAVEASTLLLTALALGTSATLVTLQLQIETRPHWARWAWRVGGSLALAWAGIILERAGGTAAYGAAPVSALKMPVFLLLATAALITGGLLPWRTWVSDMYQRSSLHAGGLAVAVMFPIGFYLLIRAYGLGDGQLPSPWLNVAVSVLGVAVALLAAARAQAATSLQAYLGESLPGMGGFALMALGIGTPLGLAAAVTTVLGAALLAGTLPLVPSARGRIGLLAVAAAVGLPPTLAFAARLLDLEAGFEASGVYSSLAVALAVAWLLSIAGGARALAALPRGDAAAGPRYGAAIGVAAAAAGGLLAGLLEVRVVIPAVSEVVAFQPAALSGGAVSLVTATGAWPAVALAIPALMLALLVLLLSRDSGLGAPARTETREPFFVLPLRDFGERLRTGLADLRVPEEYQSLFNPRAIAAAVTGGSPLLWLAVAAIVTLLALR
jgi:formate hydrogenlyase subunit 3/multisubunit Na+/H+ antiporter MnhD subunit